jgi:hypothetical protein
MRLTMNLLRFFLSLSCIVLAGCATPQEQAINAWCRSEATKKVPVEQAVRAVERIARVGEATVGSETNCSTAGTAAAVTSGTRNTRSTVSAGTASSSCITTPITRGVYQTQVVPEAYDKNQDSRNLFMLRCLSQARAMDLFKELNK